MAQTDKPIIRVSKLKKTGASSLTSVEHHYRRTVPTPNANPALRHLNRWLLSGPRTSLESRVRACLTRYGLDYDRARKDATVANDLILSISPEWFDTGVPGPNGVWWSEHKAKQLQTAATAFLRQRYGDRLVEVVFHGDETSPHVHAVVVPVVSDAEGKHRLSGREAFNQFGLKRLQTDWEAHLAPLDVGPRQEGSKASHVPLKKLGGELRRATRSTKGLDFTPRRPPPGPRFESKRAMEIRMSSWQQDEASRLKELARGHETQAAMGRLYEAEKRSAGLARAREMEARQDATLAREEASAAILEASEAKAEVVRTKEQVAALRRVNLNAVAAELAFSGILMPRENAIDLVKRVGKLDYHQALAWLAQRFGEDVAATAVREEAEVAIGVAMSDPPVFTRAEEAKAREVREQLAAIGAPSYRVTLMRSKATPEGETRVAQNLGKPQEDGDQETLFTADDVVRMTPKLAKANYGGANVFITPIDPAAHHVLVDDVTPEARQKLEAEGYEPATICETSPSNYQVLIKVLKNTSTLDKVNDFFKSLNRVHGDEKITGLIHPMRLAGYENRKQKHLDSVGRFPFVKLVSAINQVCRRSVAVLQAYPDVPSTKQRQKAIAGADRPS